MKKIILSLVSFSLPACWVGAALPQEFSVSSDITYASDYVFRGIKFADDSFQPTLEAAYGDFYAGIWANLPTESDASEINYYGGINFEVPGFDLASFDAGLTVYHYPGQGEQRTHEFYLGALFSIPQHPALTAGLYYFHDVDLGSHVGEGSVTYAHSLEALGLPASLDFTVLGGLQGTTKTRSESFNYYGGSIELPVALNEFSAVTAGVHYATAEKYSFGPGERGKNLFWTIGYSAAF